jgi:hypothetical protein
MTGPINAASAEPRAGVVAMLLGIATYDIMRLMRHWFCQKRGAVGGFGQEIKAATPHPPPDRPPLATAIQRVYETSTH